MLPDAIFSTLQGTQSRHTNQTLQRAKNATHNPPTPADVILISFILNISKNNYHQQPSTHLQGTQKPPCKRAKNANAQPSF